MNRVTKPEDCQFTNSPVCPVCGEEMDPTDMKEDEETWNCPSCGKVVIITREWSVSYCTRLGPNDGACRHDIVMGQVWIEALYEYQGTCMKCFQRVHRSLGVSSWSPLWQ